MRLTRRRDISALTGRKVLGQRRLGALGCRDRGMGGGNLKSRILVYHPTTLNLLGWRALRYNPLMRRGQDHFEASCTHWVRGNYNCNAVRRKRYTGIHRVYMTVGICRPVNVESV